MKNAINYYYNLKPTEIHQINKIYKFRISNNNYILYPYKRRIQELQDIYELHMYINSIGIYCHKIILNNNEQILTYINDEPYVLLLTQTENRKITIKDIMLLSNIPLNDAKFNKIKRISWNKLWSDKIDYIEYQISQFGKKYTLIRESSDYYIGIVENCISLITNMKEDININTVSHSRVNKETTLDEFYNPLNFIVDNRIRDISEYLKSDITKEKDIIPYIQNYIYQNKLNIREIMLFFIRIIYPSFYLDTCEKILDKKIEENALLEIIKDTQKYETNIKKIYNYLKTIVEMPEIEWITKK